MLIVDLVRRNFKSLSVLGLATTTMSTWVALTLTSTFSLINGGLAGTIWLYLASWIFTFALVSSLAELASMAPTSGGQYRKLEPTPQSRHLLMMNRRLGIRICASVSAKVSQLHRWMACCIGMASSDSNDRLQFRRLDPYHGLYLPSGLRHAKLASDPGHDSDRMSCDFHQYLWRPSTNRAGCPHFRLLLRNHSAVGARAQG